MNRMLIISQAVLWAGAIFASAILGAPLQTVDGNSAQGAAYFFARPTPDEVFADGFDPPSR